MMNCNWMVKLAVHNKKALIGYGVPLSEVEAMDAREVQRELKKRGYDFKANSPLKNA